MSHLPLPAQQLSVCQSEHAMGCEKVGPGHAMHLIQQRVVSATPSKWLDAVVGAPIGDGWVRLHLLDGSAVSVWHHEALDNLAAAGEPVGIHGVYNVVAVGERWFNVLVEGELAA
ncbi:hypothetical protein [Lacisediminihabitans sp.]|jgi:hypothetical protein|uniref:hypothetical protein n=1 Tax=Lacisediminihabitans sp. TaxID=2787631 RepID=UPI002F9471C1